MKRETLIGAGITAFIILVGFVILGYLNSDNVYSPTQEGFNSSDVTNDNSTSQTEDESVSGFIYQLEVENTLTSYQDNNDGTYNLNYTFRICNPYGFNVVLNSVTNYISQSGSTVDPTVVLFTSPTLPLKGNYSGNGEMLAGDAVLPPGSCAEINLSIRVDYDAQEPAIRSFVTAFGRSEQASSTATSSRTSTRTSSRTTTSRTSSIVPGTSSSTSTSTSTSFSSLISNPTATTTSEEKGGGDDSTFYLDDKPVPPAPTPPYCGKYC